jgi:hypothetical protein
VDAEGMVPYAQNRYSAKHVFLRSTERHGGRSLQRSGAGNLFKLL